MDATSSSTSTETTDRETVERLLSELQSHVRSSDATEDALTKQKQQLVQFRPQLVMDTLVPSLFVDNNPQAQQESLLLMTQLVQSNPDLYLKPASQAVRNEAVRLASSPSSTSHMAVSNDLMQLMVSQILGNDVQVASNATEALVACSSNLGAGWATDGLMLLEQSWRHADSTKAVRCASAVVDIACLGDDFMQTAVTATHNWQLIVTVITENDDPLLTMAVLDLLERMATTLPMHTTRAQWLFSKDVVVPLLTMAGGMQHQGEAHPILGGPALRVVAALCRLGHQDSRLFLVADDVVLTGFHRAVHNFQVTGELDRLAVVDAISSLASASLAALDLVLQDPVTREKWLNLKVAQPKLKSVILVSVAMVLDPADISHDATRNDNSVHSSSNRIKLFSFLGQINDEDPSQLVMSLAKSPIPEIRLGAYALLKAVATMPTGGQLLFGNPGFFEFIISRETEKTKEGREAKYEVIQTILASPLKSLLADDAVRQLDKYVAEGPHYFKAMQWELATE